MPHTMADVGGRVLHIRPESFQRTSSDKVEAMLAAASLSVETCPDVYRGLARLCCDEAGQVRGVIVCVDGLGPSELAFLTAASRVRRGLALLVYAEDPSSVSLTRALEQGATGLATEQMIRAVAARSDCPTPAQASAPVSDHQAGGDTKRQADDEPSPRVPWVRYEDRPRRVGPGAVESPGETLSPPPSGSTQDPRHEPASREPLREPLLTDEELRALVGDDTTSTTASDRPGGAEDHTQDEDPGDIDPAPRGGAYGFQSRHGT